MKKLKDAPNFRTVNCCANCVYSIQGYDGDIFCRKLPSNKILKNYYDYCSTYHDGLCDLHKEDV